MEPNDPQAPHPDAPPKRAFGVITPFQLMLFGGGGALIGGLVLVALFMPGS